MKNPWTKKNPFMSMWLSAANSAVGPARGRIKAQATRQTHAAMSEGAGQIADFWRGAFGVSAAKKTKKRR